MRYLVTFQSYEWIWDEGFASIQPIQVRTTTSLLAAKKIFKEEAEFGCNQDCVALYGTIELDGKIIYTKHWGGQPAGFFMDGLSITIRGN